MTRETKSYELKIYDQSLMRFEAAYDAFGSLKLEITDIDSANAHLLPLNLIVDQDEKSLASWMEGRTIPKNRAFVEQILSTAGLTRNDILGILDVSKGLSINDSYWLDDGKSDVTFDEINLFDNRFDEVLGLVAYTGYTPSQKHKAGVSSEWTLGGQFPKAVRRINDRLLLFKTGTSGARNLGKDYTSRQRRFNPFADVWLEESVHRGAGDPPHRRAQVRSGYRGNGETRPFAKVIRLGDLFWRHIPVLWYNSPIHQSINRKE